MLKFLIGLKQRLQNAVFAPLLEQNERLVRRQEEALKQFGSSMSQLAVQLERHTGSVIKMADAAQALRDTLRERDKNSPDRDRE